MRLILLFLLELISLIFVVNCSGIAKLNLQKIVPIQSGYYNKLQFSSDEFWNDDSSHTMTQDGELVIQLLYPYDSSLFDIFIFDQQNSDSYQKYETNVKSIKKQRSCVEAMALNVSANNIILRQNKTNFTLSQLDNQIVVIDNTKYPCNNGSYYPLLQLHYEYIITLNFEYSYYYAYKSVILLGVLLVLIYVSGIIIFYFRQRKQRKKLLKRQLEENQMMDHNKELQVDFGSNNNDNITSEFQSDKSVVNSLASFSQGFQKSYNQKSFFQNSLQMSQNLTSRAGNNQSGKSNTQQSHFASVDEYSLQNKRNKNLDSRRDTGKNSIYDQDKKSQDNSFNNFNETSFGSEGQFSFADKLQGKQFTSNNSLPKTSNSFIKSNNNINYYQNDELDKIQEEDAMVGSPQHNSFRFQ